MEAITATYSMRDDGGVKVLNKGYKTAEEEWSTAEGKAYFVGKSNNGFLKVSFFNSFLLFESNMIRGCKLPSPA